MSEFDTKKLQAALAARKKREESKQRLESKKKKEAEAKAAAKKATEERKEAEKKNKAVTDEREILIKLAGIKNESKSSRGYFSSQCFFDLLNLFDADNKDRPFEKKYNSLRSIEKIAQAVRESTMYDNASDTVCINGKKLREKVNALLQKKEDAITAAKKMLDTEWAKIIADATTSTDTKSENTAIDNAVSE